MARKYNVRVAETSTTTGTGAFTVAGAIAECLTFASECAVNDTFYYTAQDVDANLNPVTGGGWEVGIGTYSAANTITRTTILRSSNANAAVNFTAGTRLVFITSYEPNLAHLDDLNTFTVGPWIANTQPRLVFDETDQAGNPQNGRWQATVSGDSYLIQRNTAAGGDFSAATSWLSISTAGTVTFNGSVVINTPVALSISAAAATRRFISLQTAGVNRWLVAADESAELGSNAGSNFAIFARDDAGNALSTPFTINRATGLATFTGQVTASGSGNGFRVEAAAATERPVRFLTNSLNRWKLMADSVAESGSNAGSDFVLWRYDDAGAFLDAPLSVKRSTGALTLTAAPIFPLTGYLKGGGASALTASATIPVTDIADAALPARAMVVANNLGMFPGF